MSIVMAGLDRRGTSGYVRVRRFMAGEVRLGAVWFVKDGQVWVIIPQKE